VNIGVIPYIVGGLSILLGWLAIILRKDRSAVLFAVMIAMTAQALFVVVFEFLEGVL
jgi:glucose dehydrogenase